MASSCFSKQTPTNQTTTKPKDVRMDGALNNGHSKNAECAGFIFLCNESIKMDCFKYRVLGLSEKKKNIVTKYITKGMYLFLFDDELRFLYGIYTASSCGAFELEPDAFKGNYPWQVRFHIEKDCLPLPEDAFKEAIKDNYIASRRFKTWLTAGQVQNLIKLFSPLPGGPLQHPSTSVSNGHDAPCNNSASFAETGGCIQDRCTQGYQGLARPMYESNKADQFIQSDPLPEPTRPFNDSVKTEICMHGYHSPKSKDLLPLTPTCDGKLRNGCFQSDPLPRFNHKSTNPLDDAVMPEKSIHGYHAPRAKHGSLPPKSTCEASKADGFIRSAPLPRLNCEATNPFNDAVVTEKCMHGYYASKSKHGLLPHTTGCEAKLTDGFIRSGPLPWLTQEPTHPFSNAVMTEKCMHGYHAPRANHCSLRPPTPSCEANTTCGFIRNDSHPRLGCESTNPFNDAILTEKCMHGYHAPTAKYEQVCGADDPPLLAQQCNVECNMYHTNGRSIVSGHMSHPNPSPAPLSSTCTASEKTKPNQIRTWADPYHSHPQGHTCGNSAAQANPSVYKQMHPMPNAIQGNLLDRKLHEGDPLVDSSMVSRHIEIVPKSRLTAGVFNALPGHYGKAIMHKRPLENYACGFSDEPGSVSRTSGERPLKCMYHQVLRRPLDDIFGGAVDAVLPEGYNPSLLHGGAAEFSGLCHDHEVLSHSRHCIGCGW